MNSTTVSPTITGSRISGCRRTCGVARSRPTRACRRRHAYPTCWPHGSSGLRSKLFAAEARSAKWRPERRQRLRARYSTRVLAIVERMMIEHLTIVVPSSCSAKPCCTCADNDRSRSATSRTVTDPSRTTCAKTRSGRSSSVARAGCSWSRSPVRKPAPISTHSSNAATRTASTHTAISAGCPSGCQRRRTSGIRRARSMAPASCASSGVTVT